MMGKQIIYGEEARKAIQTGIQKVAAAVKVTLGPCGRNVLIRQRWGSPTLTKDGVTVAREIQLPDYLEDTGAQLCRQASMKTNDAAGDGTTTATVLAEAMVNEASKALGAGSDPLRIKRGIDKAVNLAIERVSALAQPITTDDADKVRFVASVSANDSADGEIVASAFLRVGTEGVVTLEEGKGRETDVRFVEGLQWDQGWISPYFVNRPDTMTTEFEKPWILFWEPTISNAHDIFAFLKDFLTKCGKSEALVIISDSVEADALATLIANRMENSLRVAAVKAPGFGQRRKGLMEDMAILTGGTFFAEEMQTEMGKMTNTASAGVLGRCDKIIIKSGETTILGGGGSPEAIASQVEKLKALAEQSDSKYDREKYTERVAKLSGTVAIIRLGANTETEMKEKKYRYEDAINATKAALEEGIVPGGGTVLLFTQAAIVEMADATEDTAEKAGMKAVALALELPLYTIAENAGARGQVVVNEVLKLNLPESKGIGYNAKTGEYGVMIELGVIDPVKVTKSALANAASIAGAFITTEAMILDLPEDKQQ